MFEFTIIASGPDPQADDFEDRFFEAGCDDATIVFTRGLIVLNFVRAAASLHDALASAVADVRAAGALVARIEPDSLVSLSDIAHRAGLTRQAISNYAAGKGKRATGFPRPVARVTTESPLWDWAEMAEWLSAKGLLPDEKLVAARAIRDANEALGSRRVAAE